MGPSKWWSTLNTKINLVERQTLWASRACGREYVRIFTSFGRDKLCGLHVLMGDKLYFLVGDKVGDKEIFSPTRKYSNKCPTQGERIGENKCPTQGERIGAAPDAALLPRLPRGGPIEEQLI